MAFDGPTPRPTEYRKSSGSPALAATRSGGDNVFGGSWSGGTEPWQREFDYEDQPLSNLYVTLLHRLGVAVDTFADSTGALDEV